MFALLRSQSSESVSTAAAAVLPSLCSEEFRLLNWAGPFPPVSLLHSITHFPSLALFFPVSLPPPLMPASVFVPLSFPLSLLPQALCAFLPEGVEMSVIQAREGPGLPSMLPSLMLILPPPPPSPSLGKWVHPPPWQGIGSL